MGDSPQHRWLVRLGLAVGAMASGCGSSGGASGGSPGDAGQSGTDAHSIDATGGRPADAGTDSHSSEAGAGTDSGVIGDPTGTTAVPVTAFLDSLGACVHVTQGVDAPMPSATALSYAGLRNIRDDGNPATVPSWLTMHAASGVRVCVLTDQNVASTVGMAEQLNDAGALLAVEGPNEPNNFPVTYDGGTSGYTTTFLPVAELQRDLYAAVKADPKLPNVPVFHASEAGGSEPDNVGLQFLTIPVDAGTTMPSGTKYADYGNTHNYVCGHSSVLSDNVAWNASNPTLNGDWDGPYVEYGHTWHEGFNGYSDPELITLPKVTTETGWLTMGSGSITEEQQGRVFLDLYLSAYKQGFSYTFIYMLRDDPVQGYWGLFDTSYNPKTSGLYIHNLTTLLADTSQRTPGKLDYSIAAEPMTVHDLLMQKSNGVFELVVWDERLTGGSDTVAINLSKPRPTVTVYDPTTGTSPTMSLKNVSTVSLMLTDHPMILELQ
jgi:hypothetical protein